MLTWREISLETRGEAEFKVGRVLATSTALRILEISDIINAFSRYLTLDFGEIPLHVFDMNFEELHDNDGEIVAEYQSLAGIKFHLVTQIDRCRTLLFLSTDNISISTL